MAVTMKRLLTIIILLPLLAGCTITPEIGELEARRALPGEEISLDDARLVKDALYRQHGEWKAVRYRWGGLSKEGIDCSGLVHLTYRSVFGITLPRDTKAQARAGRKIPRRHLRSGDLVFFRTGIFSRHVGIYMERNTFLHVSTKDGVTLSKLNDGYWSRRYWQSRRITAGPGPQS